MSAVSLTVITPGWVDDRGASVPDWTNPTQSVETWHDIQPVSAEELRDMGRQGTAALLRGFGPSDSVLTDKCHAEIDGVTYEVASVQLWPSMTGGLAHTEAVLERVVG